MWGSDRIYSGFNIYISRDGASHGTRLGWQVDCAVYSLPKELLNRALQRGSKLYCGDMSWVHPVFNLNSILSILNYWCYCPTMYVYTTAATHNFSHSNILYLHVYLWLQSHNSSHTNSRHSLMETATQCHSPLTGPCPWSSLQPRNKQGRTLVVTRNSFTPSSPFRLTCLANNRHKVVMHTWVKHTNKKGCTTIPTKYLFSSQFVHSGLDLGKPTCSKATVTKVSLLLTVCPCTAVPPASKVLCTCNTYSLQYAKQNGECLVHFITWMTSMSTR